MVAFRQAFVIQCRSTGRFLTEELGYCISFSLAGKLFSLDEAVDTAQFNLGDDFEVHGFWTKEVS